VEWCGNAVWRRTASCTDEGGSPKSASGKPWLLQGRMADRKVLLAEFSLGQMRCDGSCIQRLILDAMCIVLHIQNPASFVS